MLRWVLDIIWNHTTKVSELTLGLHTRMEWAS